MSETFDAVVVGLGAMGSATASALARKGLRVAGFDRYRPPHVLGSSHGGSRIIREAYFESPMYVPLIRKAYGEWAALEERSGTDLWRRTGGLMIGQLAGKLVGGALASAEAHDLPHELLDAVELERRFPAFRLDESMVGVWEPRAGILFPEAAVQAQLDEAWRAGAKLHYEEPVESWRATADGFEVTTPGGQVEARSLIFTAGPWLPELIPDLEPRLEVERVVQHWFSTRVGHDPLGPDALPIFLLEFESDRIFYGFPDFGHGIKMALHYQGEKTRASEVRRRVDAGEVARLRTLMERYLPGANGPHLRSEVCMYTETPDLHFLVDRHPRHERAWLVSPCSGHGFKFAPVIGGAIADRVAGESSDVDLAPFGLARF